jgi:hypothetical protein
MSLQSPTPRFTTKSSLADLLDRLAAFARTRCAVIALLMIAALSSASSAFAVIVPAGPHTFDANLSGSAFVGFTGGSFVTPVVAPTNTFGVSIDAGAFLQNYPLSSFHIDGGFAVVSSFVFDPTATPIVAGDAVFSSIGPGTFHISDPAGTILSGTFSSATFSSAVGANAGSLSSSNINGLVLTPGPAFTFSTTSVTAIAPIPTGFSISLSAIPGGLSVAPLGPPAAFIPVTLLPFAFSSGSTVISGAITVVPEPSTFCLAGLAVLMLAARRWKHCRVS